MKGMVLNNTFLLTEVIETYYISTLTFNYEFRLKFV